MNKYNNMDKTNVVVSSYNEDYITIYPLNQYNSLLNVDDIFNNNDVANIGDIIDDAILCNDYSFIDKIYNTLQHSKGIK